MKSLKTRIAVSSLLVSSMVLLSGVTVLAQVITPPPPAPSPIQGLNATALFRILGYVVGWIYIVFFVIAIVLILLAAFTYLTSGGDPAKVTSAKNQLIYAAVAVAIAILSYSFVSIVNSLVAI